ncbi:alpha/beta fold hydrolase [Sphingomonas jatrophae]|uniref:4,5:9,10-diseco-3-hydroxy-5,9,17-trioxoandrosta-1(10),2-diene-4-oate hydrolase n=1 Tax=Sphingomonas jatrophae TaxID=1166337 RepID=A0A1I6KLP5_9SPHN|nr:alpha/beta hydrolase [Sphingomonas jatrophae]SFR92175.1 4,5:9,10-diseco-3-hydroxy-5,9,17-trioxoandrosta-1(10),2-diene-4-oate hydrolase [Sphingomonas jatrophae]
MAELQISTHRVSGDYDIVVAETGPADGPAVVFLHGSGPGASGRSNFRKNVDAFVAAGYRVLLPDLIGYGASSKPEGIDYTLQLFTDTVYEALQAQGVTKATLIGNSLGGGIALQMTLDHPEFAEKLVLMAPGCVAPREDYFVMPGIAKMVSNFGGPDFNVDEQKRLIGNLLHPDAHHHITDQLVEERFAVARTQPKDVLVRMRTPDLGPRLGEITQPIFVLWGLNDEFCPEAHSRLFLDRCPDVRAITFARTGHWVQVERAEEFNRYSLDFLRD